MAASKELITKIVLKAQADGSISKAFSALSKNSDTCLGKLSKMGEKAKKAFTVVAGAAAAGAVASAKAAIDYESAFAGVQKTVDETDTTSYEKLSQGIRNLAKETPAAATEIADVAAAAGQLGIKADDVLSFSKVMIDLGESTNLTSDEAATSIAKLFNVTGTSMGQVSNFGSTLVALGNNAATTESDILAMATRIAGSGKQIGLTEQQILALSTSLSSVGIEAEMGGSAISTIMSQMDKDVASNSEELKIWAETAGMSAKEFSKMWKSDAYGALQTVMKGMADTKAEGGNLNLLLEDLGINSIRQGDTLKRLSSATGLMSEMTDLANKSWSENSALTKEANTRYATTASRIQILKNNITDAGITIGNAMLPAINSLIDKMGEIDFEAVGEKIANGVQWIIDNFDKVKVAIGILAGAFAAFKIASFITTLAGATKEIKTLFGVLKGGGPATSQLPGLGTKMKTAGGQIASVNWQTILSVAAAFVALGAGVLLASGGIWLIADASAKLAASGGAAIAVMFGLIGALAALAFGASLIGPALTAGAVGFLAFGAAMLMVSAGIWVVAQAAPKLAAAFSTVCTAVIPLVEQLGNSLSQIIQTIGDAIASIYDSISGVVDSIGKAISGVLNSLAGVIDSIGNAALNAGKGFTLLADGIKTITGLNLIDMGASLTAAAAGVGAISVAAVGIGSAGTGMKNLGAGLRLISMYAVSASSGLRMLPSATASLSSIAPSLASSLTVAANSIRTFSVSVASSVSSISGIAIVFMNMVTTSSAVNSAMVMLTLTIMKVSEVFSKTSDNVVKIMQALITSIVSTLRSGASGMYNAGADMIQQLVNGMRSKLSAVRQVASQISSAARISVSTSSIKIPKHGDGGTFTTPHQAIIGDKPETIVPHGNTPRNRALLSEAARGVGATGGGNVLQFTFAPVIHGGNAEENRAMIHDEEELFERKMKAFIAKNRRLAF